MDVIQSQMQSRLRGGLKMDSNLGLDGYKKEELFDLVIKYENTTKEHIRKIRKMAEIIDELRQENDNLRFQLLKEEVIKQ